MDSKVLNILASINPYVSRQVLYIIDGQAGKFLINRKSQPALKYMMTHGCHVHCDVCNRYKYIHSNVHMDRIVIEEFNHWWLNGKVDPDLALPFKRDCYYDVSEHMAEDRELIKDV